MTKATTKKTMQRKHVNIRFAGDSGDGMQLMGTLFANASAIKTNDLFNFADYPAEIRAPAGTVHGVSGYQLSFADHKIYTPGDKIDVLVAMNPAALKTNLADLIEHGTIIYNADNFTERDLTKAGYAENPLSNADLLKHRLFAIPMNELTLAAVKDLNLSQSQAKKCKNMLALGIVTWIFDRPLQPLVEWVQQKFHADEQLATANVTALETGYNYALATDLFTEQYTVNKADLAPGVYRKVTGNQALALGCVVAAQLSQQPVLMAGYPITPASTVLHELAQYKQYNVTTFQAEDEISAICAAIGAAYGGSLAATVTSGPGLDLKTESLGLAVMSELPLVTMVIQRAGPSTGMPTKSEQTDLLAVVYGRHGECPIPILAPATPHDCFAITLEAFRLAIKYMTPVIILSDGYLATGADAWRLPDVKSLPDLKPQFCDKPTTNFTPYQRDPHTLARPWVIPGTPGLEHRIGSLEKHNNSGNISYEPQNHHEMVNLRQQKINGIANDLPPLTLLGKDSGDILVIAWGSTYGAVTTAVTELQQTGMKVSALHLRYLYPLQKDLAAICKRFNKIFIPELNSGQLHRLLRMELFIDSIPYNQITGKPFSIAELKQRITEL